MNKQEIKKTRFNWLLDYRYVRSSELKKPAEILDFKLEVKNEFSDKNEIVTIEYPVYTIEQTKQIIDAQKIMCIDLFSRFYTVGAFSKIATFCHGWHTVHHRLECNDLFRHITKPMKENRGRFGFKCDKDKVNESYGFIQIDYDNKAQTKEEWINKIKTVHAFFSHLGNVIITNVKPDKTSGFHVFVVLKKKMKLFEIVELMEEAKKNDNWIDIYCPNAMNKGIRLPFDYDRCTIDSSGKLVHTHDFKKIFKIIDSGSNLKNLDKIVKNLDIQLKNPKLLLKPKKEKKEKKEKIEKPKKEKVSVISATEIKHKNNWVANAIGVYEHGRDFDPERGHGSLNTFAYAHCSGFIKLMIMRGDDDAEILSHVGNSVYVSKQFSDVSVASWRKCIATCRMALNSENDAIYRIWMTNRTFSQNMLQFFASGDPSFIEVVVSDYECDAVAVQKLAEWLRENNFIRSDFKNYARFYLTLVGLGKCSRNYNRALLRKLGLVARNCEVTALVDWAVEHGMLIYNRSYGIGAMRGKASTYAMTDLMREIIAIKHEIEKLDTPASRDLISAVQSGSRDMVYVCYVILLNQLRNTPDYLLTAREKIVLSELEFFKYAMME